MQELSRRELLRLQQLLIDAFPDEYDVVVANGYIAVTTSKPPIRSKRFKTAEEVDAFLKAAEAFKPNSSEPEPVKAFCRDIELKRIKDDIFPLLKFKRVGKYYQCPTAELKIWLWTPSPGGCLGTVGGMNGFGPITRFNTADELLEILASGRFR